MNVKFLALTARLMSFFQNAQNVSYPTPQDKHNPRKVVSLGTQNSIFQNSNTLTSLTPHSFFTKIPEEPTLLERYQKAQKEYLTVLGLVPADGKTILLNLEKDFQQISQHSLSIHHRLRLKNLTEIFIPHVFKEYTFFKIKKTDNGIPADVYLLENLKIASRQVQEILILSQSASIASPDVKAAKMRLKA